MASPHARPRRRAIVGTSLVLLVACLVTCMTMEAAAQLLSFPPRAQPAKRATPGPLRTGPDASGQQQMLVQATEIQYDYSNDRVIAAGNVQIYFSGSTLEADKVIYAKRTKRLHAEGNVRLTEADGKVTYGEILDLSDDYRDGFVDSLRLDGPDQTRVAASRAERSAGNFTVFHSGVYTACEPCKDDPRRPPLWQVKAARIIHDQGEKMIYFEGAQFELFGAPIAYLPYFSTPDPTVSRKSGVLMPTISSSSKYGIGVEIPYFIALAPDYDMTLTPMMTSRQGLLMQAEWRQRLINGAYTIRGAGIFQQDRDVFLRADDVATPGYRNFRGSVETSGQFALSDKWVWGWDGVFPTDKTFFQDYNVSRYRPSLDPFSTSPTEGVSQAYVSGRGARSYFDARTIYYYGFSEADDQRRLPIIHPVMDYSYTLGQPVLGGEFSYNVNALSLSREMASLDAISPAAMANGWCLPTSADTTKKIPANCLLRGFPGTYGRVSTDVNWRTTIIDPYGQVFTPFINLRADVATMSVQSEPGVENYLTTGESSFLRAMPVAGVEYRYPFIGVQSWGTQTIEPIAQLILRPNETGVGKLPNEDAQSLLFDDSNLFRVNKFSGWDRVEGGTRANVGVQYTAQFNRAGFFNVLFGQSYHLFGTNSFAAQDPTNTGLGSGLETNQSDYVARVSYQPNRQFIYTSRFRFDEGDLSVRRFEFETQANFDRWTVSVLYGNYDAQPELGFLTRRQGILGTSRVKVAPNWMLLGGARYDLQLGKFDQTQIGAGYVDDCLILAVNYITNYTFSGNPKADQRVMLQFSLRTLGGTSVNQSVGTGIHPQSGL
jgi:LPS-assembly protein